MKSVCLCVSQSVRLSVCHMKRVERSTDHNPSPNFTKLVTKLEAREMWLAVVLVEIRKTEVELIFTIARIALMENIFNVKYL